MSISTDVGGLPAERAHVVLRRGILGSLELPEVRLDVSPGTVTRGRVFIVDANVSKGMSGGLAVVNCGAGEMQQAVLGLIHGTQRLFEEDLRDGAVGAVERAARQRLMQEIEIVNGRIVYVVPFSEVVAVLEDVDARTTRP